MKALLGITLLVTQVGIALAQVPAPASVQTKRILFTGAEAHLGNGTIISNSAIGFEGGKLKLVADVSLIKIDKTSYDTIINLSGKRIYPGLIAMNTDIGLSEIEAVRATNDFNETGNFNPSVRSIIAYNTDSKVIPTLRSNGVLMAQVSPQGGVVSGQSSVVQLDAWNYEDAAYKTDIGLELNWPSMRIYKSRKSDPEEKQKERTDKALAEIRRLFIDARAYAQAGSEEGKNQNLEALKGLFDGSKKLYVHCNYIKEIIAAISFCEELKIKMVLVGGTDALLAADLLKEYSIPVVLTNLHRLPSRDDEDVDMPYKLPYELKKAGIKFAISVSGFWQNQNLSFQAGTAAGYGLTKEEALQAITSTPSEILGINATTGTLETGKDATFIITSGDLLDMKSSIVEQAFIQGRNVSLEDTRKVSYKKYKGKYGLN